MFNPPQRTASRLSERTVNQAKAFLSAMFMGLRTAKIHSRMNQAYENAVRSLYEASRELYAATQGFRLVFVGDNVLLNEHRLRLDPTTFSLMRTIRGTLEVKQLGGLEVRSPPTYESSRALMELLASDGEPKAADLERAQVVAVGPQAFTDDLPVQIDPVEKAVRVYAKLLLAIRTQVHRFRQEGPREMEGYRLVRVIQDAIDATTDSPHVMLHMVHMESSEYLGERHGANTCILTLAMGQCLGFDRGQLADLGLAASLHHLGSMGPSVGPAGQRLDDAAVRQGFIQTLSETVVSPSVARRGVLMATFRQAAAGYLEQRPGLMARVMGLCSTYSQLLCGFGLRQPVNGHPLDIMTLLRRDRSGRFDPNLVDLLMNMLRIFPVGSEVLISSGERALVVQHGRERPWDRPVVRPKGAAADLDLMERAGGHFVESILGTARCLDAGPVAPLGPTPEPEAWTAGPRTQDLDILADPEAAQRPSSRTEDLLKDFLSED